MHDPVWSWGILGLILLAVELATGTFYILWFGIAGLCMSIAVWLLPTMSHGIQFLFFAVLSIGSLAIWKITYKPKDDLRVGQSRGEEIGRIGTMTSAVSAKQNGRIQFAQGVLGSREWVAISDESIEIGEEAAITSVEGNSLRVKKHH